MLYINPSCEVREKREKRYRSCFHKPEILQSVNSENTFHAACERNWLLFYGRHSLAKCCPIGITRSIRSVSSVSPLRLLSLYFTCKTSHTFSNRY
ncbi:uncharacterized protein LOC115220947 isoform X2 [Octopus sinensis]|uniref:Uncharacterized protein LOC115220947 isoform X2 n=1 Tax=Octopus sinensis TaxID=2607531 RepID=A0A7E6FF10_9MOLL|nr:uncharacterized protein LOC115220947 isoform X2 [Octopus sinensis]